MKITIIICAYNQNDQLIEAARSILNQAMSLKGDFELIVVDNHSTDEARKAAEILGIEYPRTVRYLFEPLQGRSFALNSGISAAKGQIVVITDDDIIAEPGWLAAICDAFEKNAADGVGGPVIPMWKTERPSWLSDELFCKLGLIDYGRDVRWLDDNHIPIGCNIAIRREVFDRAGMYNTELGRNREVLLSDEDDEFFTRLIHAGGKIFYDPKAAVRRRVPGHRMRKSYLRRLEMFSGMSNARTHGHEVASLLNIPRHYYRRLFETVARASWLFLTGRWSLAFRQNLFLWYLYGYTRIRWRKRRPEAFPPR